MDFYNIPIIENSYSDLSLLDLSFLNISILNIKSKEFKNYVLKIFDKQDFDFIFEQINKENSICEKYAITLDKPSIKNLQLPLEVFKFLLIINHSNLSIDKQIIFDYIKDKISLIGIRNEVYKLPLSESFIFEENQINDINSFARIYFKNKNFIEQVVENYYNSFKLEQDTFQFVSLCICLENMIKGNYDLNYRIKRMWSMICGDTLENKEKIFKNLKEIYLLRSKIVHGEKINDKKLTQYLFYLRNLVSIFIIKVLLIDNEKFLSLNYNLDKINEWFTTVGFNDKLISFENFQQALFLNFSKKINVNL